MPDSHTQYNLSPYQDVSQLEREEDSLSDSDEVETQRRKEVRSIQKKVFEAICAESRSQLKKVLYSHNPSLILQVLVTFTYPNHDGMFHHDHDILKDAAELLGSSVLNLNAIQTASMLGEEDLAIEIIDYVAQQSVIMSTKKVLFEFMSKVWGSGNTILHLASFMGMSNLVKRLIELGANTNKRNERNYKAVDCADDDRTRSLFLNLKEVVRYPIRRSMSVDGNSPRRREGYIEPIFTRQQLDKKPTLQRAKAIHNKKHPEHHTPRRGSHGGPSHRLPMVQEELDPEPPGPNALFRTKSLGFSSDNSGSSSEDLSQPSQQEDQQPRPTRNQGVSGRRVIFDPKTLALDFARSGDYIELKRVLENPNNSSVLLADGERSVFDISTRHLRLSLLHLASSYNHLSICQYLIENKAWVNPCDREGWTPIHCAAAEGHDAIVKFLLSIPAISVHILNADDESPCDVASNDHIRTMLKEKLVRRISMDFEKVSSRSLDESLGELQRATLVVPGCKGGDSGLLRPSRSMSLRPSSKPFSPPHSFSKPLLGDNIMSASTSSSSSSSVVTPSNSSSSNELYSVSDKSYRLSSLATF